MEGLCDCAGDRFDQGGDDVGVCEKRVAIGEGVLDGERRWRV